MKGMYGITGIRVKVIEESHESVETVNAFLEEYNGNILDIQTSPMAYGLTKYIIVYRAIKED